MKSTKTLLSYLLFMISLEWKSVYALPGSCSKDQFTCKNKECITNTWQCDGENDCGDNSDESDCDSIKKHRPCDESTNFRCKNKKCIPKSWTCDHVDDCGDNSDESNVDGPLCVKSDQCARDDFKCKVNGFCILQTFVCDGSNNCGDNDNSDEHDCKSRTCGEHQMKCDNGRCVSNDWKCDKSDDCGDASDERNCSSKACPDNRFKCVRSGHCIRGEYKCDGAKDCLDGSDEVGCIKTTQKIPPMTTATTTTNTKVASTLANSNQTTHTDSLTIFKLLSTTSVSCNRYEYQCRFSKRCVHISWLCDGANDCRYGEDEDKKLCSENKCSDKEFRCLNGQCIDNVYRCDEKSNCYDGSDEKNCSEILLPCSKHTHHCNNSDKCIDNSLLCNNKKDCPEGDDESNSCGVNECSSNNGGCLHYCRDLPIGHICTCKPGYKLALDNKTCVDIDECSIFGRCSQGCVNFKGSFGCQCDKGYILDPVNRRTCHAQAPHPRLILGDRGNIREMSTNDRKYKPLISDARSVRSIAVHVKTEMIYWTGLTKKKIYRASMSTGKIEVVLDSKTNKPEALAIDWVGHKLFWIDTFHNERICVSNLNGSHIKTLVNASAKEQLIALAVYAEKGFIYWKSFHPDMPSPIKRANLDGTDRMTIVEKSNASDIAVDKTLERIYWAGSESIYSCAVDGSDVRKVLSHIYPYLLTVFEDSVYWIDGGNHKLYTANKFTGRFKKAFKEEFTFVTDILVYHPLVQNTVLHPCLKNNGGCSHLCFVSPNFNRTCACPDLMMLGEDNKTCTRAGFLATTTSIAATTSIATTTSMATTNSMATTTSMTTTSVKSTINTRTSSPSSRGADSTSTATSTTPATSSITSAAASPTAADTTTMALTSAASTSTVDSFTPSTSSPITTHSLTAESTFKVTSLSTSSTEANVTKVPLSNVQCTTQQYRCVSTGKCIPVRFICDGKSDCAQGEDEKNCIDSRTKPSKSLSTIGVAFASCAALLFFVVVAVIVYRKKRRRSEFKMTYEMNRGMFYGKNDGTEPEIKYLTNPSSSSKNCKKNLNFDNMNFKEMDELKVPLHVSEMYGETVDNQPSDDSSNDFCFDDTRPIMSHML